MNYNSGLKVSNVPLPISEARQRLIAPCIGLGAYEAIAAYAELSLQRCQKRQKGDIFAENVVLPAIDSSLGDCHVKEQIDTDT